MKHLSAMLFAAGASLVVACGDNNDTCDPTVPNTICTIAGHSAKLGYKGDGGPATSADLYIPMESRIAPDGSVWFIDFNNYVIRRIDPATGTISTLVGTGNLGDSPASDGLTSMPALQTSNNHTPTMIFHDGYLYLAAWHESRVKRVALDGMTMENFAGRATRGLYDGDGAPAMMAALSLPSSVAFDPQGNVVVMDQENQVVRMIDSTNTIHTIAGQCIVETAASTVANGCVPTACPNSEKLVCGDPTMLCDSDHVCTAAFAGDGGPALNARLGQPGLQTADPTGRIAYDRDGDLLIADTLNNRIRKIDPSGIITTLVGTGVAGYSGDGGPATQAAINHPVDVAVGDDGTVYFTDVFNHCVRAVSPSGIVDTVVGRCHFEAEGGNGSFGGDGGAPREAELNKPYSIDIHDRTLYVSDSYNNRLRQVNLP